jgi:protein tyrosine/serine phosphatase
MRWLALLLCLPAFAQCPPQLANCGEVDSQIYRSAQPTGAALVALRDLQVRAVIDLQDGDRSGEKTEVEALGLVYYNVPMRGWGPISRAKVLEAVELLGRLSSDGRVLVHCAHGQDRTGTVVATWRMLHGWKNQQAFDEARFFGINPLQFWMRHFIQAFVK